MIDYLRLLIRNPHTNEQLWFEHPFDMDEITKTLHIQGDEYEIIDSDSSMPVYSYNNIECIIEDYNDYLLLPDYIKKNITPIVEVVDSIGDVFNAVTENRVELHTDCKDKYNLARKLLEQRTDIPSDIIDYIDLDKYIYDATIDSDTIETPDGIIEIKY